LTHCFKEDFGGWGGFVRGKNIFSVIANKKPCKDSTASARVAAFTELLKAEYMKKL